MTIEKFKNLLRAAGCPPSQIFFTAIIFSGIKEKDWAYFKSPVFEYHCRLLGLNAEKLKLGIYSFNGDKDAKT